MNVKELTRDQMVELKQNYMIELADEGTFAEVMNVDYDHPAWGDMAYADDLVPDDVIFEHYGDIDFVDDDFWCTAAA